MFRTVSPKLAPALLASALLLAAPGRVDAADTVSVGIYLVEEYDVDFPGNQLALDFYLWFNYRDTSLNPLSTFEIVNAKEVVKAGEETTVEKGLVYQSARCRVVLKHNWNVTHFPFDRHRIAVHFEDNVEDVSRLVYVADTRNTRVDDSLAVANWRLSDFAFGTSDHVWHTTYGDPLVAPGDYSTYSRFTVSFLLGRVDCGAGMYLKCFVGLLLAVLVSFVTLCIKPTDVDPRFGLSVGAIFASFANLYVVNGVLPQTATMTFVDLLHTISFGYIFACIVVSAVSLWLAGKGREQAYRRLDRVTLATLAVSYAVIALALTVVNLRA